MGDLHVIWGITDGLGRYGSTPPDPRIKGVSVPAHFADRSELVLNFSHRFFIDDFTYDERAVCASLSFSGRPYFCVVPWASVKMLLSHHDNAVAVFDADMLY